MARDVSYCDVTDLLTGDIPTSQFTPPQKFVQDAADEIDTYLGSRYATPIVLVVEGSRYPASLLLKRLNSHIATGRLIMAAAASQEESELHAYGRGLVNEALKILRSIANGETDLRGYEDTLYDSYEVPVGPAVMNPDPYSRVEAFYGNFPVHDMTTPRSVYGYGW